VCWRRRARGLLVVASLCSAVAGCARLVGGRHVPSRLGGLERVGPLRRFTPQNLYDAINGEAPLVISFGFRSLVQADYGRQGGEPLVSIDLYDMGCEDNAFALYRAHASMESTPVAVGTEGAGDDTRVEFWQGRFCAVVTALPAAEAVGAIALARELSRALPPTRAWPRYLGRLPAEDRVLRSEQYAPRNFLGHEFLEDTVSARYKAGGREVMAFVCGYGTEESAARALRLLDAALGKHKPTRALGRPGQEGLVGEVPGLGRLAVFRRREALAGVLPYADEPELNALLERLDRRLGSP